MVGERFLVGEFHHLPSAVVKLVASLQITPHGGEEGDQREF